MKTENTDKKPSVDMLKQIGQRIRETRIDRGLNQAELAFRTNISEQHISLIELGKKEMRIETFIRIIECLQVSADEILRPDVPEVSGIYQKELAELLYDCNPMEAEAILTLIKQVKTSIRAAKDSTEEN